MLTHEKPMIDLICLLVNYFFISVKFFKETHTCLTNYLMLLLFPFWFSWSTFIEIDDSESEDFVLERYRAYWERKLKSGPPHPDFEAEIAEIADSAKNNTIQRIVAETPMALLYKKDFKKLPRWDFEDVYSKDTQHRRPVSMLRQDIVKTVERINFMDVSQHSWSHIRHIAFAVSWFVSSHSFLTCFIISYFFMIFRHVLSLYETLRMRNSRRLFFLTYVCFCTKTTLTWASGIAFHISTVLLGLWTTNMMVGLYEADIGSVLCARLKNDRVIYIYSLTGFLNIMYVCSFMRYV